VPYRSGFGGADFYRVHQGLESGTGFFPSIGKFHRKLFQGLELFVRIFPRLGKP
jgi:hypothetical protein